MEEYAVFSVTFNDIFDGGTLTYVNHKAEKKITLMCFKEELYKRVVIGECFSFKGFVSFGYGNTFLVVKRIYDQLDFPIDEEQSLYFANYSPKVD